MSFIRVITFKVELSKPTLMDFIARTPADLYFLVISEDGSQVYGIVTEETTIEYLTNEFIVKSFELVPLGEVKKALATAGCKKSGNHALLEL